MGRDREFRLGTVKQVRETQRDRTRLEFADALRAENALREEIAALHARLDALRRDRESRSQSGTVPVAALLRLQRCEAQVRDILRQREARLDQLVAEVERCKSTLVTDEMALKMLEKLEERQR